MNPLWLRPCAYYTIIQKKSKFQYDWAYILNLMVYFMRNFSRNKSLPITKHQQPNPTTVIWADSRFPYPREKPRKPPKPRTRVGNVRTSTFSHQKTRRSRRARARQGCQHAPTRSARWAPYANGAPSPRRPNVRLRPAGQRGAIPLPGAAASALIPTVMARWKTISGRRQPRRTRRRTSTGVGTVWFWFWRVGVGFGAVRRGVLAVWRLCVFWEARHVLGFSVFSANFFFHDVVFCLDFWIICMLCWWSFGVLYVELFVEWWIGDKYTVFIWMFPFYFIFFRMVFIFFILNGPYLCDT